MESALRLESVRLRATIGANQAAVLEGEQGPTHGSAEMCSFEQALLAPPDPPSDEDSLALYGLSGEGDAQDVRADRLGTQALQPGGSCSAGNALAHAETARLPRCPGACAFCILSSSGRMWVLVCAAPETSERCFSRSK